MEQRSLIAEKENRQQLERSLMSEVERLQRQVDIAKQSSEQTAQCGEDLQREVCLCNGICMHMFLDCFLSNIFPSFFYFR